MRVSEFQIKNYRSIREAKIDFIDQGICTLIGPNGSGKSNILKALYALFSDDGSLSDEDFYVAEGEDENDEIKLSAIVSFESKDNSALEKAALADYKLSGFEIIVSKARNSKPTVEFHPIGFSDNRATVVAKVVSQIVQLLAKVEVDVNYSGNKDELFARLRRLAESQLDELAQSINEFEKTMQRFSIHDRKLASELEKKLRQLRATADLNLGLALEEIVAGIDVALLDLEKYQLESDAELAEMANRDLHPFLYDLLVLSGKSASDFSKHHSPALSRTKDAASRQLTSQIAQVWPSHRLRFQVDVHGERLAFMVFTPQGRQVALTELSDGEQWFLKFYVKLAISARDNRQTLWLFDEPGRDLHTTSQVDLKQVFESMSSECQIIYTSHLAMMIPWHRLERIFVVENTESYGTTIHNRFWKDPVVASPLKQALSTFVGEELIGGKEHVIVEGVSDYFILQGWVRYFGRNADAPKWLARYSYLDRVIVPVDGIEKIPLYCWFLGRKLKKQVNWVAIVDSAAEAEVSRKKMTETGLGTWTKNLRSISDLVTKRPSAVSEIEGVFSPSEYYKCFVEFYSENYSGCKLPSYSDVDAEELKGEKFTKVLSSRLAALNPNTLTEIGKPIALDKTGIAQHIYARLCNSTSSAFSKETEGKFARILENVDKTFANEEEEASTA
jgi:predicted ATPase